MNYRYHTGRAMRPKGHWFGEFEGTELRSEDFDTLDDFLSECLKREMELLSDREDFEDDANNDE